MSEDKYDFSEPIQRKIVAMLLYHQQMFAENVEMIEPHFFDSPALQSPVGVIRKYYEEFKEQPTEDEFLEEYKLFMSLDKNRNLPEDEHMDVVNDIMRMGRKGDFEYVQKKVIAFARYQAAKHILIGTAKKRKLKLKVDTEGIIGELQKSLLIGEDQEKLGSFYKETFKERLTKKVDRMRWDLAIPTNLEKLNDILGGGIVPGEVGIIMGPMKRGKTAVAINFGKGAVMMGYNVLHYCLEASEEETQFLYDVSISGVEKDVVNVLEKKQREIKLKEISKAVGNFFGQYTGAGRLLVKESTNCSPLTIETHLNKLRIVEDFKPDLLIIDYLGLLKCADKNIKFEGSSGGKYVMLGEITKELIRVAKRMKCAIWLLHQTTRKSFQKLKVDMDDSGDSLTPMQDAHIILTINPEYIKEKFKAKEILEEREDALIVELRIFVAGGRSVKSRQWVTFMFDKTRCQTYPREDNA
jgi:replicative DNA helicase